MASRLAAALGVLTLCAAAFGYAASLTVTPRTLGGGVASVPSCDGDGFTLTYTVSNSGHITTVSVSNIAAACAGGTLRLTLGSSGTSVGSGTSVLPSSGFTGSASVSVSPTPLSSTVTATYANVEGP